jgi:AAA domain-containing protein
VTVILAIANQKSGAGKMVTAANLAAGFARADRRTLAVDCDAQAHLTRWLLGRADQDAADLEAIVAGGADPAAAVQPTRVARLDALPATGRLARIARALAADGTVVARALGRLRPRYDAIVLDLPSSLGRLTVSALAAADGIVIPVTASALGLHGLAGFRDWLASFRTDRVIIAPVWGCCSSRPTWTSRGRCGPGLAATCGTPWPTSGSLARGCCRCWCPVGLVWTTWCPSGCCWATRRPMPGRAETWSTPTPGWSTTWWSGCPPPGGSQARGPRSERRARAGRDMAASVGLDASHLCASILPGSETSQRSHTIWHETVLRIDSRTTP